MWALNQRRNRLRLSQELLMRTALTGALAGLAGALAPSAALALPQGGTTTIAGDPFAPPAVTITPNGANELDIIPSAARTVVTWNSFNIAQGEKVQFTMGGRDWISLNRTAQPITIDGNLSSVLSSGGGVGGSIWLVSPNGILFGSNAQVSVGGLLATTATPSLFGTHSFLLNGNGTDVVFAGSDGTSYPFSVTTQTGSDTFYPVGFTPIGGSVGVTVASGAQITAGDSSGGGLLAFIAPFVNTQPGAQISAPNSRVFYGATNSFELTIGAQTSGDLDLVSFIVNDPTDGSAEQQAMNLQGTTSAASVHIVAVSVPSVVNAVVLAPGAITATRSAINGQGEIVLLSGLTETLGTDPTSGSTTISTAQIPAANLPAGPVTFQTGALSSTGGFVYADVGGMTASGPITTNTPAASADGSVTIHSLGDVQIGALTTSAPGVGGNGQINIFSSQRTVTTGVISATAGSNADVNVSGQTLAQTGAVTAKETDGGGSAGINIVSGSGNVTTGDLNATGDANGSVDLEASTGNIQAGAITTAGATSGGTNGSVFMIAETNIQTGPINTSANGPFANAAVSATTSGAITTGDIHTIADTDATVVLSGQTVTTGSITTSATSLTGGGEGGPIAYVDIEGGGATSTGDISTSAPAGEADVFLRSFNDAVTAGNISTSSLDYGAVQALGYTNVRTGAITASATDPGGDAHVLVQSSSGNNNFDGEGGFILDPGQPATITTGDIHTSAGLTGWVNVTAGGDVRTGNITAATVSTDGDAHVAVNSYTGAVTTLAISSTADTTASVKVQGVNAVQTGAITTTAATSANSIGDPDASVNVSSSSGDATAGAITTSATGSTVNGPNATVTISGNGNATTGAIRTAATGSGANGPQARVDVSANGNAVTGDITTAATDASNTSGVAPQAWVEVTGGGATTTGAISTSATGANVNGAGPTAWVYVQGTGAVTTGAIATNAPTAGGDGDVGVQSGSSSATTGDITTVADTYSEVSVYGQADVKTGAIRTSAANAAGDAHVNVQSAGATTVVDSQTALPVTNPGAPATATTGDISTSGGANDSVQVTAGGTVTTGKINTLATTGDGTVTLSSSNNGGVTAGDITADATGSGLDKVTVSGPGALAVGAVTSTHQTVTLTGSSITAGAVQANQAATVTGTGAVQLAGIASSTAGVNVTGSSVSAGVVSGPQGVSLIANGGGATATTITAGQSVTVSDTAGATVQAATAGGGISIQGGGAQTLGSASFTGAGAHSLTLTGTGATGDVNLGQGTGSVTGATSVVLNGSRDVNVDVLQGVGIDQVTAGRNLLVRTTRTGTTGANAQLGPMSAGGAATVSIDGAVQLASLTAASARISAESLSMGTGVTVTNGLELDSRLGAVSLGDAAGASGLVLSNADFGKLRASQVTIYAGDPTLTGARGNVTIGALDIDTAKTPSLSVLADSSHQIQVSGQVAPLASGGSFTLGSATDPNWRPASIGVSGAIGASSSADGIVYTGVRAFGSVGLYATNDVTLGSARFQGLIAGTPAGSINIYAGQPAGVAATAGEIGHVFLTAATLSIGAGGKVVGENTSPVAGRNMGVYLTNALQGPLLTTVLSIDPPTVIDLYGAYVGRTGLLYNQLDAVSGGGVTVLPSATADDRFNGCLIALASLCGQTPGVSTQITQLQGLLASVNQASQEASPVGQSELVILSANADSADSTQAAAGPGGQPAPSAIGDSRGSRQDSELIVTGVGNEESWRTPDVAIGTGNEELSRKRKEPGK
jgi:filamentous hemagglutinin family protein